MLEIRADDLRFTPEEAASLLAKLGASALSSENIQALNTKAEGWVVGLKMAFLSLRSENDVPGFISSFTGSQRHIMDYLLEEVLQRQAKEAQDFLLQTSILERLSGPLCDAVTRRHGGREMLLSLEKSNLFIVPLDASREWCRYEHLFAELLRHQLEQELGKEMVAELQRRASRWFEGNGFLEDAIYHTLTAQDWNTTMRLISLARAGGATLVIWLRQIPKDILVTEVELYFRYISALLEIGLYNDSEAHLNYLERATPEDIRARVAVMRTTLATIRHEMDHVEKYAKQALELLPQGRNAGRASVSLSLGGYYMQRNLYHQAEPLLKEAYETYQQAGDITSAVLALTYLGVVASSKGKKHQGKELFERAISLAGQSPIAGAAHAYLGRRVYYEWNELEKAVLHLKKAIESSRMAKGWGARPFVFNYLGYTLIAQGDIEGAKEALNQSDHELIEMGADPYLKAHNAAYHIALDIAEGNPGSISQWVDRLSEYEETLPPDIPHIARSLLFERGGKAAAEARFQVDFELFTRTGMRDPLVSIILSRALATPSPEEALSLLGEAFAIAKPEGYIRSFVDWGMSLTPLLRKAISRGIEPEYSRKLLDIIEAEERQRKIRKGELTTPPASVLSEREMEVLRFMAEGLTNQQIADRLFISLYTVKAHVRHILDKLDAQGRSQAITRARDLKLF